MRRSIATRSLTNLLADLEMLAHLDIPDDVTRKDVIGTALTNLAVIEDALKDDTVPDFDLAVNDHDAPFRRLGMPPYAVRFISPRRSQ